MSHPAHEDFLSVDEYLVREERASERHEYVAGVVYAMTGGTARHNLITLNVAMRLRAAAREAQCRVFANDLKVRAADDVFYYPDVLVSCVPVDESVVYVREPCLVVEVISPSSAVTDRREKLLAYRAIGTLQMYLVVDQRRRRVEVHRRRSGDQWDHSVATGDDAVELSCPPMTLSIDEIYEGVMVPVIGEPEEAYDPDGGPGHVSVRSE